MNELGKKLRAVAIEKMALEAQIAAAARHVVPVLVDSGRTASAEPLQALFFVLDAKEEEFQELINSATPAERTELYVQIQGLRP